MADKTLDEIAGIENVHADRMTGVRARIEGTDIVFHLRPLTVGMVAFATSGGSNLANAGTVMVRLAIEKVEGLEAEFEKVTIGSRQYRCVTEEWCEGLVGGIIPSLVDAVRRISHLTEEERIKLDFTSASE